MSLNVALYVCMMRIIAVSVGDMVAAYNDKLRRLVGNHAPLRTMTVMIGPDCP